MKTRIYLFTGFLDSGKTSFIKDTLLTTDFCADEKSVLVVSEEGEIEYIQEDIEAVNCDLVYVHDQSDLNTDFFQMLKDKYNPTQILIEVNGMYNVKEIIETNMPEDMDIVQVLTTINAETFSLYLNNMRSLVYQHVLYTDLLIFNRINDSIKKSFLRNNIKAINNSCQIIYENNDGTVNTIEDDEMPFDISGDHLNILDHDFGLFCMDTIDHPEKYHNKTVTIRGKFIGLDKHIANGFIIGREAMVCCEDDTSLVGMVCVHNACKQFIPNEWLELTGKISLEYDEDIDGYFDLLHVTDIKFIPPLEKEYVTFD